MPSIKLPILETAQVASVKMPISETVWILEGFIVAENIIEWKTSKFTLIESIKSRIIIETVLVDKNHIKLKWFGDSVPLVQVFMKTPDEAEYPILPTVEAKWDVRECTIPIDTNAYDIKVIGVNNTGESNEINIGGNQEHLVDIDFTLPMNEKYYFTNIELISEYRIEVDV